MKGPLFAIQPEVEIAVVAAAAAAASLCACIESSEGKKVYTKGVFSSENASASTGNKEVWCIPKSSFSREKKENTYTPKSLQGVFGGPLRAVLVYRFWPPMRGAQKCQVGHT